MNTVLYILRLTTYTDSELASMIYSNVEHSLIQQIDKEVAANG